MHGLIFAGKLTGVPVKTIPTEGATNGAASLTPVQDLWENSFKKIGDENPEQTVTGMLLFYPHQLVGYLEASANIISKLVRLQAEQALASVAIGQQIVLGLCICDMSYQKANQ